MEHTSIDDPTYHAAVVDLLGVLAYGELTAFIRMAVDSDLAPTLHLKSAMAGLANTEYVQYSVLVEHMRSHDIDPDAAMAPFVVPFASYHERTKPRGWLEGLVKAYVGDGIAKDFYREMSQFVDESTRDVMARALDSRPCATASSLDPVLWYSSRMRPEPWHTTLSASATFPFPGSLRTARHGLTQCVAYHIGGNPGQ